MWSLSSGIACFIPAQGAKNFKVEFVLYLCGYDHPPDSFIFFSFTFLPVIQFSEELPSCSLEPARFLKNSSKAYPV